MPSLAGPIPNRKFAYSRFTQLLFGEVLIVILSRTDNAGDPIEYTGIDVLILQHTTKLIKEAYSEWNNGELLYDLGERV
jgi:hypothetical protein